jgi:NAD-dependent dihydropyrimidine dehydrogenase PreA subunit
MRVDATFIGIEVPDEVVGDAQLAAKLEEVCPVSIYANAGGKVEIVEGNVDECILCRLCIDASNGAVTVHKLYSGETLGASG